jgi:transposase InsO family protein
MQRWRAFFALLQRNVLDRPRWATREQLRIAIVTWIERTYHRRRRQAGLGRLTPIEFEAIMTTPAVRPRDRNCHLIVQQSRPTTADAVRSASAG